MTEHINPPNWVEFRKESCQDGECSEDSDFQTWMKQLGNFVFQELGKHPTIKIHSYQLGDRFYLAIDIFSSNDASCIAITIFLSGSSLHIFGPAIDQFDITLPGIIDALFFIQFLFRRLKTYEIKIDQVFLDFENARRITT